MDMDKKTDGKTTVGVSRDTHDRIKYIAYHEGLTNMEVVRRGVKAYEKQLLKEKTKGVNTDGS